MLQQSQLYPRTNAFRQAVLLDGLWRFRFDPAGEGQASGWPEHGLPDSISMPVPGSFADLFTDNEKRNYCGDFWYETEFYLPDDNKEKRTCIRFSSITHRASIFCNGVLVARHEGGFLPVVADVTEAAQPGRPNRLVVLANNELNDRAIPCGSTTLLPDGSKYVRPFFDFFNYAGIQRSVWLVRTPLCSIRDFTTDCTLDGQDALLHYRVETVGDAPVTVELQDAEGRVVASGEGAEGTLRVQKAHLWQVRQGYLYRFTVRIPGVDEYSQKIGLRTVSVEDGRLCINHLPVYLKGFGKHEDFDVLGKSFNGSVAKRDFECMKWTGANCFRTSHYPYAEEWYEMADEEGFLVIDEVPAVGMVRSTMNFLAAGRGGAKPTCFFEGENVPALKASHLQQLEEMMVRDRNHPCVIAWSLFNEPESITDAAHNYFAEIFDAARTMDPQHRPLSGAMDVNGTPEKNTLESLCDFLCLNRYYGWYIGGGPSLLVARNQFVAEMEKWQEKAQGRPVFFTEFGADTLSTEHRLPGTMWSQEYQDRVLAMNFEVFDRFPCVQGELVWNFADFQTSEVMFRPDGNKKGVFTRNRQPKDAAYRLKERWANK